MLADQFLAAAVAARNNAALDETARLLWRAHGEGKLADAEVEATSGAMQARRAALTGEAAQKQQTAILGLPRGSSRHYSANSLRPGFLSNNLHSGRWNIDEIR